MKYAKFPFGKIPRNSRVVLYGAGRVGRSMFEQNKADEHCIIVGVVDSDKNKEVDWWWGDTSPDYLVDMQFDYILISVCDENFGSVFSYLAEKEIYKDKLVAIDIGEKSRLDDLDVAVIDDSFHGFISDNRNWNKTVKDYACHWSGNNNRGNKIRDNYSAAELLLKSYQFENPVFHVINEKDEYKGSISKEAIRNLSLMCTDKVEDWTVASVLDELNRIKMNTDFSANISSKIFDIYTLFVRKGFNEVVILENGKVNYLIRRLDFQAMFCRPTINSEGLYIANRWHYNQLPLFQKYRYSVYSQSEEDGIIAHIFQVIGLESHYAVEFGAWDGVHLSNVRNLVLNHDMSALFIEGDPNKAKDGVRNYKNLPKVTFVTEYVGIKQYRTLEDILCSNNAPKNIDIMSIDIDGWDYWVWDSLKNYRPRVVIVEFNPTMWRDLVFINPSDEKTRTGSSAKALVELGVSKGYELLWVTGCNLIFCVREEFDKFGSYDNSLEALWAYAGFHCLFSTFNGDVYGDVWGRNGKGVFKPIN